MKKIQVAIIGSGNIGSDLMMKIIKYSEKLELSAMIGIQESSHGLNLAKKYNIPISSIGIDGLLKMQKFNDIKIVFDATSASSHYKHYQILKDKNINIIDLTPAAIGPYVVPTVNLSNHIKSNNINMVTCGGQATIPIVFAVSRIANVIYAEIVASISSISAGPGTRSNIDEFTKTTAEAIKIVGKAQQSKAIIILNPANPPIIMRDTVYCIINTKECKSNFITDSILNMIKQIQLFVPGYKLKHSIQYRNIDILSESMLNIDKLNNKYTLITVLLEITGRADYLPDYAGNLDIMTAAAMYTAECYSDGMK